MATLNKEKFCSIISEIIDRSSKDVITDTEDLLEYDAVELTLLLKAIGFRLNSLEFDSLKNPDATNIEVEIRCKQSGILSKLSMKSKACTCPSRKATNNNSYWEIQGTEPVTPITNVTGIVQDTSCNLLPDITKKTANLSKIMLTVLLQHYQQDFKPESEKIKTVNVKQVMERLQIKRTSLDKNVEDESKIAISPAEKPNVDSNTHCSTPLSSINITPIPSYEGPILNILPKVILTNVTGDDDMIENEKPPDDSMQTKSLSSLNSNSLAITPINNELTFDKLNSDNERDICLIQSITEARKQLETALLMLKCNVTIDISHSSLLTVTPQNIKQLPKSPSSPAKRKSMLSSPRFNDVNIRRHSTGGRFDTKSLAVKNSNFPDTKKKSLESIKNVSSNLYKPDTPRPIDGKKLIDRLPNSASKAVIKRTSTGTNLKSGLIKTRSVSKLIPVSSSKK